jgi:hypothetical protein
MFEPENQIERDLMRASADAGARPAFARAMLDTEVFVVLIPQGGAIAPRPDGNATVPAGTKLTLATGNRDGQIVIPFFTAPSRAKAWFKGDHIAAPDKTRDLFARHPETPFFLNPGSDYGKEYTPAEIKRMLEGKIDGEVFIPAETKILLAHPKERPDALIATLAKELGAIKEIRGAWLMLAMIQGQPEQSWMLGVDQDGDWSNVRTAVSRATAGDVLKGRVLDVVQLSESSLAPTLRTGIPVIAARRGFFNLFR